MRGRIEVDCFPEVEGVTPLEDEDDKNPPPREDEAWWSSTAYPSITDYKCDEDRWRWKKRGGGRGKDNYT